MRQVLENTLMCSCVDEEQQRTGSQQRLPGNLTLESVEVSMNSSRSWQQVCVLGSNTCVLVGVAPRPDQEFSSYVLCGAHESL